MFDGKQDKNAYQFKIFFFKLRLWFSFLFFWSNSKTLRSKFYYFSFQSSNFIFFHFSSLSFKTPQFNSPLTCNPILPLKPQNDAV